jgi:hypothetical protein
MKRFLLALLGAAPVAIFASDELSLSHSIAVPAKFCSDRDPAHKRSSAGEYADAYETGWERCVEIFCADIDHKISEKDREHWGSYERGAGWSDGFAAAEKRIGDLLQQFGRQSVKDFLAGFTPDPKAIKIRPDQPLQGTPESAPSPSTEPEARRP